MAYSNTKPAKTAWRPPKHGRHIPCNALIATRKGRGVAAIRNADHDGDEFGFSNDPRLLEIHDATPEGAGIEEFLRVEAEVKDTLSRAPAHRLKGVAAFRKFCVSVDILPVRGIACAMVEKVLCHILFKSPDPRQDGSLVYGIKMGACSHAANDAPQKKFAAVLLKTFEMGTSLLEAVGDQAHGPRCSVEHAALLRLQPGPSSHANLANLSKELAGETNLGKVWMPSHEIRLSSEAA